MTFYDIVALTIDPAEPLPIDADVTHGSSSETGHAIYIPFIDPDPRASASRLLRFSSAGCSRGLTADL